MKEETSNPKIGPTEKKKQGDLHFDHYMLHDSDKMAPGDRVKYIVHGHVHENRAEDDFGPGNVHIKVHAIENHPEQDGQKPVKKPNASEMRMDDLKKKVIDLMEKDENMEGHSESGVKEKGEDE